MQSLMIHRDSEYLTQNRNNLALILQKLNSMFNVVQYWRQTTIHFEFKKKTIIIFMVEKKLKCVSFKKI